MSILGQGQLKLPEHLLSKGDQNKDVGLRLARVLTVARYINEHLKSDTLKNLVDNVESYQLVIGGKSRVRYAEVLKTWNEPQKNNFNNKE